MGNLLDRLELVSVVDRDAREKISESSAPTFSASSESVSRDTTWSHSIILKCSDSVSKSRDWIFTCLMTSIAFNFVIATAVLRIKKKL